MNPWTLRQPTGSHDDLATIERGIAALYNGPFTLIGIPVDNWNRDLAPWEAPPIFGNDGFGDGARHTLQHLLSTIDGLASGTRSPVCIGGYSMAGLFALYAAMHSPHFDALCAVSPSVWFPGWIAYAEQHPIRSRRAYISLGDREHRSRNPLLQQVNTNVQRQYELFPCEKHLDWNEGTHFTDPIGRMVKGYLWVMGGQSQPQ